MIQRNSVLPLCLCLCSIFIFVVVSQTTTIQVPAQQQQQSSSSPPQRKLEDIFDSTPKYFTFRADRTTNFPNPERGFHNNIELFEETDLTWVYDAGYTLTRTYIRLDEYRTVDILPEFFLQELDAGLALARQAGIKVILRFSYNFPDDDDYENAVDAPLERVLGHIPQLAPVLQRNADVIAVLQAGFIGAWGEWHSSSHQLTLPANKHVILQKLLHVTDYSAMDTTNSQFMVQLRYPYDLMREYPSPIIVTTDPTSSTKDQARTGHHNDCFLASKTDVGTYSQNWQERKAQKQYLATMARNNNNVMVGGETCSVNWTNGRQRSGCTTALRELQLFHYTYLNDEFHRPVLSRWKRQGCYAQIAKKLGYRYRFVKATANSEQIVAGQVLVLTLWMRNDGWAGIANPRHLQLILRNRATGDETIQQFPRVSAQLSTWLPQPQTRVRRQLRWTIPSDTTAPGEYDLFLHLPDVCSNLAVNPQYSIRFANRGDVWESTTGYNKIGSIQIIV